VTTTKDLDWRLTIEFESKAHARGVFSAVKTHASSALAASRLKEGVVVQHDAEWLRIYGDSFEALRRGQVIVASVIELEGVKAEEQAEHRVEDQAEWERAELPPLPEHDASLVSEHHGKGPWGAEVDPGRVQAHFELGSRHAAQAFAKELIADGYDVHQAGSFLFIFAEDIATAHKLGSAIKERAPADAELFFEGDGPAIFI
jgi:hypothetical protein